MKIKTHIKQVRISFFKKQAKKTNKQTKKQKQKNKKHKQKNPEKIHLFYKDLTYIAFNFLPCFFRWGCDRATSNVVSYLMT